jgi:hypothetical protein
MDKEIIIGDAREADGNTKIYSRKVVTEKTPDGGETLRSPSQPPTLGGRHKQRTRHAPLFYTPRMVRDIDMDGPGHCRTV